ncbi:MAG: RDD family protein [Bacteroidales bacterium]|nr:RDD family protein [Bacteroidales bacterium]
MQIRPKYAGLRIRFLALLIDLMLFCMLFSPATRLIKGPWIMSAGDHRWNFGLFIMDLLCFAFPVFIFIFFVLLEGRAGATLGKWIRGMRVTGTDGKIPGLPSGNLCGTYCVS